MDQIILNRFFSGNDKMEKLITCLQFSSEIAQSKFHNEDQLYSVVDKGLLYKGMLAERNHASVLEIIDLILDKFSEISEKLQISKTVIQISRHPHEIIRACTNCITHISVLSARCSCPVFVIFEFGEDYYVVSIEEAKIQSCLYVGSDVVWRSQPTAAAITASICRLSAEFQRTAVKTGPGFVTSNAVLILRDGGDRELSKISRPLKDLYKAELIGSIQAWRSHKEHLEQYVAAVQLPQNPQSFGPSRSDIDPQSPLESVEPQFVNSYCYDGQKDSVLLESTSVACGSLSKGLSSLLSQTVDAAYPNMNGDVNTVQLRSSLNSTTASVDVELLGLKAYAAIRDEVINGGLWMSESYAPASVRGSSSRTDVPNAIIQSDQIVSPTVVSGTGARQESLEIIEKRDLLENRCNLSQSTSSTFNTTLMLKSEDRRESIGYEFGCDFNASMISSPVPGDGPCSYEETIDAIGHTRGTQGPMSPYLSRTSEHLAMELRNGHSAGTASCQDTLFKSEKQQAVLGGEADKGETSFEKDFSARAVSRVTEAPEADPRQQPDRIPLPPQEPAVHKRLPDDYLVGKMSVVRDSSSGSRESDALNLLVANLNSVRKEIEDCLQSRKSQRALRRVEYGRQALASVGLASVRARGDSDEPVQCSGNQPQSQPDAASLNAYKSPSIKALHKVLASIESKQQKVSFAEVCEQIDRKPSQTAANASESPGLGRDVEAVDADDSSDEVANEERIDGLLKSFESSRLPKHPVSVNKSGVSVQKAPRPYLNNYIQGIDSDTGIERVSIDAVEAESCATESGKSGHHRRSSAPGVQAPSSAGAVADRTNGLVKQPSNKASQQRARSVPRPDPTLQGSEPKSRRKWVTDEDTDERTEASASSANSPSTASKVIRAAKMDITIGNSEGDKERRQAKFEQFRGRKLLEAELRKKSRDAPSLPIQQLQSQHEPLFQVVSDDAEGYTQQYLKKATSYARADSQKPGKSQGEETDDLLSIPSSVGMSSRGGNSASGSAAPNSLKLNIEESVYSAGSQRTAASGQPVLDITSGLNLSVAVPKPVLSSHVVGAHAKGPISGVSRGNERQRPESVNRVRAKQTNHQQIRNAISTVCLAGSHFEPVRTEVLYILEKSTCQNGPEENFGIEPIAPITQFLVLLAHPDTLSYKGLYGIESSLQSGRDQDTLRRLHGRGPKSIPFSAIVDYFKYESSARKFAKLPTRSITTTTDGFCIDFNKFKK